MQSIWNWYLEKCRLSHVLIGGAILWSVSSWLMLREIAPVVYVGLHFLTTGVFFWAALRLRHSPSDSSSEAESPGDTRP